MKTKSEKLFAIGSIFIIPIALYLFYYTASGRTIVYIFLPFIILGTLLGMKYSRKLLLPFTMLLFNAGILLYLVLANVSTEVLSKGSCMDVCIGEGLLFRLVQVIATLIFATLLSAFIIMVKNSTRSSKQ